jgi:hypothetical protein
MYYLSFYALRTGFRVFVSDCVSHNVNYILFTLFHTKQIYYSRSLTSVVPLKYTVVTIVMEKFTNKRRTAMRSKKTTSFMWSIRSPHWCLSSGRICSLGLFQIGAKEVVYHLISLSEVSN